MPAISHITVGVASLAEALTLWCGPLGLEVVARRDGPDADLGRLFGLAPGQIRAQALVGTPGVRAGRLHFVEFDPPGPCVRDGAQPTDLGPKSLDVACRDIVARQAELRRLGFAFRSEISDYRVGEIEARETQMPAHDATNIVLIETCGESPALSARGYGAVTSFVVIVPDTRRDATFLGEVLGLEELMHHRISGAGIERAVGLPPGTTLDLRLLGCAEERYGRLELIQYEGLRGTDRFARAKPPARGSLHCAVRVAGLPGVARRAAALGAALERCGRLDTIVGAGEMARLCLPSGLRLDLLEEAR
jgi:catechol 2,3-dioxygenase-like lactoylglutathione lyase family enzyme